MLTTTTAPLSVALLGKHRVSWPNAETKFVRATVPEEFMQGSSTGWLKGCIRSGAPTNVLIGSADPSLFRLDHVSTGLAALGHGVHEKNIGRQARPCVCLRSLLFRATITLHWAMRRKRLVSRPFFHIILPWFRFILSSVQFFDPQAYNQTTWRISWVHSTTPIYLSLLRL